jgi:hypothetical protein
MLPDARSRKPLRPPAPSRAAETGATGRFPPRAAAASRRCRGAATFPARAEHRVPACAAAGVRAYNPSMNFAMRRRVASSGNLPVPAPMF